MYCPVCLHDSLKIATNGVVKLIFNGKSKSTSQIYFNLLKDSPADISKKLEVVINDYFSYYSNFQNKDSIDSLHCFSFDFKCTNNCVMSLEKKMNVVELVFSKENLLEIIQRSAKKHNIPINIEAILKSVDPA